MGFNYQWAIREQIYVYIICGIDIDIAVIILSQFSQHPAKIHYQAVKHIFVYLDVMKTCGLVYWHLQPREDLPLKPKPKVTNHL